MTDRKIKRELINAMVCMAVLLIMLITFAYPADDVYAAAKLSFSAKVTDITKPNAVKCRWNSEVKGVKRYRITCFLNGKKVKNKYSKKARGSVTFKKLKKNREYEFRIKALDRKDKVLKIRDWKVFTGLEAPFMDTWEYTTAYGDRIEVGFYADLVDRIYLYRKAEGGSWKKIKTYKPTKKDDLLYIYKDKNVKAGKTYKYRTKAKKTVTVKGKKKTVVSPYSEVITMTAMNVRGQLSASYSESTPAAAEMPYIEAEITMDRYNYDTVISFENGGNTAYVDNYVCEPALTQYEVTEYRIGSGSWQKAEGTVTLKPGDSLGLKFSLKEGYPVIDFTKDRRLALMNVSYNSHGGYMMVIYPKSNRGFIYPSEEEWG